jgi:ketosteroid isomerase-like protein
MSSDRNRQVIDRYLGVLAARDNDGFRSIVHPDAIFDWPQTRERIRGADQMSQIDRNYPGGLPDAKARRVVGVEDRWVIDPMFIPRRISGSGDVWVAEADFRYPDGSDWAYCIIIELRDRLVVRTTEYWAPRAEAPAWRAQWVEPMPDDR